MPVLCIRSVPKDVLISKQSSYFIYFSIIMHVFMSFNTCCTFMFYSLHLSIVLFVHTYTFIVQIEVIFTRM